MTLSGFLWLLGFALFFVGERMFGGGEDPWRWALSGGGLLIALVALGLLWARRGQAAPDQRQPYTLGVIYGAVGLLGPALYGLSTDPVVDALGLVDEAADRWSVAWQALAPIAWLAGTLPLLSISRAISLSPVRIIPRLVKEGALSALAVSFALSMLVPLNYLATETNERWDLGYFKTAQAGTRTRNMVAALEEPIRVVAFFPTGSDVADELRTYFDPLQGGQLQVEYVDHALEPSLAEELKIRDNGYVAFVKGEQVERVKIGADFDDAKRKLKQLDEELQKSLVKLARGQKVAYFTVGHGELYWRGTEEKDRKISTLKQVLEGLNFKVKELGLAEGLGVAVPEDAEVVFVMGPTEPFLAEELAALDAWRAQGGALFVAVEPGGADLSGLLGPMGLSANLAAPLAIDNYFLKVTGGPGDKLNLVTNKFSSHASVTTLSRNSKQVAAAFPGAVAIVEDPAASPGKVQVTIRALAAAWQDLDGDLELDEDTEKRDQYGIAVAVSGPVDGAPPPPARGEEDAPEGEAAAEEAPTEYRAVVMGDATWASDLFLLYSGNGQIAVDALSWLAEDPSLEGETTSEEDVKIQHTKEGQGLWFYGSAAFVPFSLLALGLGRLGMRKRRGTR